MKSDGISSIDKYKLWGLKRRNSIQNNEEEIVSFSLSENENKDQSLIKLDTDKDMDSVKLDDEHMFNSGKPGFGNMIKHFWSKYIYSGFKDMYGKNKHNDGEHDGLTNQMNDDYSDFYNQMDLMKDMNQSKELGPEPEFNLDLELDGLEKL